MMMSKEMMFGGQRLESWMELTE